MTNREQAKTAMFITLDKELTDDKDAYEGNEDYEDEVEAFRQAYKLNQEAAEKAHADNRGFSKEKLAEKMILSDMASNLSGKAFVKFTNLQKYSLAEQLHIEPTDYSTMPDSQCANLAQAAHELMGMNLNDLSPRTITVAKLSEFQEVIDKFKATKGNSEMVHEVSPELTRQFKDSFKPVMMRVRNLKLLTRDYKKSNEGFYTRLMASTKIPTVNIRHTYIEALVVGKDSGKVIAGAVFTLEKCKKSGTSDHEGKFMIAKVKAVKECITGMLDGKVIYKEGLKIRRGKTNSFEFVIEGM